MAPFLEHTCPARRIAALELLGSLLLFMFAADRVAHLMEVHISAQTQTMKARPMRHRSGLQRSGPALPDGTFGTGTETGSLRVPPPCQTMLQRVGGPTHSPGLRWVATPDLGGGWLHTLLDPATGPPGSPHAGCPTTREDRGKKKPGRAGQQTQPVGCVCFLPAPVPD